MFSHPIVLFSSLYKRTADFSIYFGIQKINAHKLKSNDNFGDFL